MLLIVLLLFCGNCVDIYWSLLLSCTANRCRSGGEGASCCTWLYSLPVVVNVKRRTKPIFAFDRVCGNENQTTFPSKLKLILCLHHRLIRRRAWHYVFRLFVRESVRPGDILQELGRRDGRNFTKLWLMTQLRHQVNWLGFEIFPKHHSRTSTTHLYIQFFSVFTIHYTKYHLFFVTDFTQTSKKLVFS